MEKETLKRRILIEGSSGGMIEKLKVKKKNEWVLKYVTAFFDNANFLITKYKPLTNGVYLILELDDQTEIHLEGANCGYYGEGPRTMLAVLKLFGIEGAVIERLIFGNDAVKFEVEENQVQWNTVDTSFLFYPKIRERETDKSQYNKICSDGNVSVDLEQGRVRFYNPQRNCWVGMINLINYMDNIEFEYYIGKNSPLDNGLYLDEETKRRLGIRSRNIDLVGVEHVNLILSGSNFSIACLIDRKDEIYVIESIYFSLTKKRLFDNMSYTYSFIDVWKRFLKALKSQNKEIYGRMEISKRKLGNRRY